MAAQGAVRRLGASALVVLLIQSMEKVVDIEGTPFSGVERTNAAINLRPELT